MKKNNVKKNNPTAFSNIIAGAIGGAAAIGALLGFIFGYGKYQEKRTKDEG